MIDLNYPDLLETRAFIGGEFVESHDKKTFDVFNPYNGEKLMSVADCGVQETSIAIEKAHKAFKSWRQLTGTERGEILRKWYELQIEHLDDLSKILTIEQGKPISEAKGEIAYGASFVEWFAEEAKRVYGDTIPGHQRDKRIVIIKQPIGVVAAITPWNFPNAMITRKVAPALAAGCTVIIKPSELTPLSANALAFLAKKAGFPDGVLNIINTSTPEIVAHEITESALVRKISFTGSTAVGKKILKLSADTVKKVSLELGGNAPFIVFEDSDIDEAVQGAITAKYRNAGQTCVCANRIFIHKSIFDKFTEKFVEGVSNLKMGSGLSDGVEVGPLIEEKAALFVEDVIRDATTKGAKVLFGGSRIGNKQSLLFEPTVLSNVKRDMKVFDCEIFGPLAPLYSFENEEEVVELANDTHYGLAAYFYGKDHSRIWRVAEALEYGMVGINTGMISTAVAPFGGVKESGFGREGSKYGIDEYLNVKYLCWKV